MYYNGCLGNGSLQDWIFSYFVVMTIKHKYLFIIGLTQKRLNYIINITNKQHLGWYYSDRAMVLLYLKIDTQMVNILLGKFTNRCK